MKTWHSFSSGDPWLEARSGGNAIFSSPNNGAIIVIVIIMPVLCYQVKHFFYIPVAFVYWGRTTSQTREFATAPPPPVLGTHPLIY
jgi:hypothetical protein